MTCDGQYVIRARGARIGRGSRVRRDQDVLEAFREDAAHFPDGRPLAVAAPTNEAEIVRVLQTSRTVLAIGARPSLTGGATCRWATSCSDVARMNRVIDVTGHRVRAQTTLTDLDAALRRAGRYYPPAPTFTGAFVGGIIRHQLTAGAATFSTARRDRGRSADGRPGQRRRIDVERVTRASDGYFRDQSRIDERTVPHYRMPEVALAPLLRRAGNGLRSISSSDGGHSGIISVTLRVVPERPSLCLAWVPRHWRDGIAFVARLRNAAVATWRTQIRKG
jgi:hypothetical protein